MLKIAQSFVNKLGVLLLFSVFFVFPPQSTIQSVGQTASIVSSTTLAAAYPNMNFSTFLGGSDGDEGYGIAVTDNGSCYVTGYTASDNFPTLNAYNSTFGGGFRNAFVTKFSTTGSLLWSTFLGGSHSDIGYSIAVGDNGSCYVTGGTGSSDFPTLNAYNSTFGGWGDAFVAKLSINGSLLWSTYLGGSDSDIGYSIAVGDNGSCYVTGYTESSNFPTLNAYDNSSNGLHDVFVSKLSSSGSLLWSSYLGGSKWDDGYGIAVANGGSCYVTGRTESSNFPLKKAYDIIYNGNFDAFLTKFSTNGSLLWSTYLGGSHWDKGLGIAVASDRSCYVTGYTASDNFPTLNAYDSTYNRANDFFLAKFSSSGSLLWSTYLGGSGGDEGHSITVADNGSCYVTGYTGSSSFPTLNAYDSSDNGGVDVFVSKFFSNGSLLWSTYLGGTNHDWGHGIAVGDNGSCYVTGYTSSNDFPIKNAYDSSYNAGDGDIFITKFVESSTKPVSTSGFLCFLVVLPIFVLIIRIKRK